MDAPPHDRGAHGDAPTELGHYQFPPPPATSPSCGAPASNELTIIGHASPNSSSAITQEVVSHFAISPVAQYEIIIIEMTMAVSQTHGQDITNSTTAWSATVPTSFAGVVAVSELCAFPVVLRQTRRASRPTYISDLASAWSPAATLP